MRNLLRFVRPISLRGCVVILAAVVIAVCIAALYVFVVSRSPSKSSVYAAAALIAARSLASELYHVTDVVRGMLKMHCSSLSVEYITSYPVSIANSKILTALVNSYVSVPFRLTDDRFAVGCLLPSRENICLISSTQSIEWWVFNDPSSGKNYSLPLRSDNTIPTPLITTKSHQTTKPMTEVPGLPVDELCLPTFSLELWKFEPNGILSSGLTLNNVTCVAHTRATMLRNAIRARLFSLPYSYIAFVVDSRNGTIVSSSFERSVAGLAAERDTFSELSAILLRKYGNWKVISKGISLVTDRWIFGSDWFVGIYLSFCPLRPKLPHPLCLASRYVLLSTASVFLCRFTVVDPGSWVVFVAQRLPDDLEPSTLWLIIPILVVCFPIVMLVVLVFWALRHVVLYTEHVNAIIDPEIIPDNTLHFPALPFSETVGLQTAVIRLAHHLGHPSIRSTCAASPQSGLTFLECGVVPSARTQKLGAMSAAIGHPASVPAPVSPSEKTTCTICNAEISPEDHIAHSDKCVRKEWARAAMEECDEQLKQVGEAIQGWDLDGHLALEPIWKDLIDIAFEGTTPSDNESFYSSLQGRINVVMSQIRSLDMGDCLTTPERRTEATATVIWTHLQRKKQAMVGGGDYAPVEDLVPSLKTRAASLNTKNLFGKLKRASTSQAPLQDGCSSPTSSTCTPTTVSISPRHSTLQSQIAVAVAAGKAPLEAILHVNSVHSCDSLENAPPHTSRTVKSVMSEGKKRPPAITVEPSSSKEFSIPPPSSQAQPEHSMAPRLAARLAGTHPTVETHDSADADAHSGSSIPFNLAAEILTSPTLGSHSGFSISDFTILRPVSSGTVGHIFLCQLRTSSEVYALKIMSKEAVQRRNMKTNICQEAMIMKSLRHPFIVTVHAAFTSPRHIFMVMEYLSGGDCMAMLQQQGAFPLSVARLYVAQMALALNYIHDQGYLHRDVKPENMLISTDGKRVKLTDFACCERIPRLKEKKDKGVQNTTPTPSPRSQKVHDKASFVVGTPDYIAPELLSGGSYGREVDFWSLGIVLFEFLVGVPPFNDDHPHKIFHRILNTQPDYPESVPAPAASILFQLLQKEPSQRLGSDAHDFSEFKAHPFFNGVSWDTLCLDTTGRSTQPFSIQGVKPPSLESLELDTMCLPTDRQRLSPPPAADPRIDARSDRVSWAEFIHGAGAMETCSPLVTVDFNPSAFARSPTLPPAAHTDVLAERTGSGNSSSSSSSSSSSEA